MGVAVFAGQSADKELGVFRWQLPPGTNWVGKQIMPCLEYAGTGLQ
jgi:hypothetical protein